MSSIAQPQHAAGIAAAQDSSRIPAARSLVAAMLDTAPDRPLAIVRASLGAIIFPHGAQHLVGWFGGYGFAGTFGWMSNDLGFPAPLAALAIMVEFFGSIALVVGFAGRIAALGIIGLMLGAITTHVESGFFMNWYGSLPAGGEGYEYHLLVVLIAGLIVIRGSGAWSLDHALARFSLRRSRA